MAQYFGRVMRALIVTCLGIGGGIGLLVFIAMLLSRNDPNSFRFGLQAGLIIGLLTAVIVVAVGLLMDCTARLFLAKGMAHNDVWQLEQIRDVPANGTAKEVIAACRQALLAVPYVKAVQDDIENLITRATIGTSWRSAGEDMEVEINPVDELKWTVRCISKPRSHNMVFDYGKNFENVEIWRKEFNAALGGQKRDV